MRREALRQAGRGGDLDAMTDTELFAAQDPDFWYIDLCLETLHRLPIEVDALLLCRTYTELQAYQLIKNAMTRLTRAFQE